MTDLLGAALEYLIRGWNVVPLWWPIAGWCACRKGTTCPTPGKHPCLPAWRHLQTERAHADALAAWWTEWPTANIGILTGVVSQLAVVDIDPRNGGDETLHELDALGCVMPEDSGVVATGGGGLHHYVSLERALPTSAPWAGIDLKADGGLIVAPPSRHASGRTYKWIRAGTRPLPSLPDWVRLTVEDLHAPPIAPTAPAGTIVGDDLVAAFSDAGLYRRAHRHEGWHRVVCPWADEHSNADDEALLMAPGATLAPGWGWRCLHAHCAARHIGDVLDWLQVPRRRSA